MVRVKLTHLEHLSTVAGLVPWQDCKEDWLMVLLTYLHCPLALYLQVHALCQSVPGAGA